MGVILLCLSAAALSAEQLDMFAYTVVGDTFEITGYPTGEVSEVDSSADTNGRL